MKILAIDTSCDETAAAVTDGVRVVSNIVWSQAGSHAKFGGVMPSLAQRMHEERIDPVVNSSLQKAQIKIQDIDAIAVTAGPGLSIALGVGIKKAVDLTQKYKKKLIAVNHLEGHILSPLASPTHKKPNRRQSLISDLQYPAFGLVISGGNTILASVDRIGKYEVLAETADDALGEALDKGARMLGLGYPGGPILEKFAKLGNPDRYSLPTPIAGQEHRKIFTYSGLKTAMMRLVESQKPLTREKIYHLAASYQNVSFIHLIRVCQYIFENRESKIKNPSLLVGGGVAANTEVRRRIRKMTKIYKMKVIFPYSKKLYGDNAAMIGVTAYYKALRSEFIRPDTIDRSPNLRLGS
jgi:N6-L-threonylcarbamoyladenine synthase